jgi:hypothetical protein
MRSDAGRTVAWSHLPVGHAIVLPHPLKIGDVARVASRFIRWCVTAWRPGALWPREVVSSGGALTRAERARFDRYCEAHNMAPRDRPATLTDWLAQEIREHAREHDPRAGLG